MRSLHDYLDAALAKPWAWGSMDCCFFAGNWIVAATDHDPLGPYRGTYDTALGARRLIARRGGLLAMVDAEMDRCGFKQIQSPDMGDIGVVAQPSVRDEAVAKAAVVIFNGRWWIARMLDGVIGTEMNPVATWRIA